MAAPLYRQFDRADLDREYSPSLLTGGKFESDLADYARLSARLPGVVGFMPDIAYGDHPDEILDLLLPPGAGPWPLHIFIHGGYWQAHSQRDFAFIGPAFQKRGVAYASLNYTIAPAATIGAMIAQCRRAVAWLHANAARFGVDRDRITVSGHSAGAHLGAMLLAGWDGTGLVRRSLLISGVYDLEPIRLSYVDGPLRLTAAAVAAWSPLMLDLPAGGPCAIVWGENESGEFKRQSRAFAEKLMASGCDVTEVEFAAVNHFDILFEFLEAESCLLKLALGT